MNELPSAASSATAPSAILAAALAAAQRGLIDGAALFRAAGFEPEMLSEERGPALFRLAVRGRTGSRELEARIVLGRTAGGPAIAADLLSERLFVLRRLSPPLPLESIEAAVELAYRVAHRAAVAVLADLRYERDELWRVPDDEEPPADIPLAPPPGRDGRLA